MTQKTISKLPSGAAILLTASSTLIMSFSNFIPVLPIIVFYAIWFSSLLYKKEFVFQPTKSILVLISLLFICLLSFFWSASPMQTLYFAVAFVSMMLCMLIIARIVTTKDFVKGATLGIFIVMLITLLSGNYHVLYTTGESALVGFFAHKNTVGSLSAIGIFLSSILILHNKGFIQKIVFGIMPFLTCLICLFLSLSKTSLLAVLGTYSAIFVMFFISRFPKGLRLIIFVLMSLAVFSIYLGMIALNFDFIAYTLELLGKNSTLTGRTELWQLAIDAGNEKFPLGWGYQAFWQPINPLAQRYWDLFNAPNEKGFHFHNLYLQMYVDLGLMGVCLISFIFLYAFGKSITLINKNGMTFEALIFFGFVVLYFVRSIAEIELLGPFGVRVLIFYVLFIQLSETSINQGQKTYVQK